MSVVGAPHDSHRSAAARLREAEHRGPYTQTNKARRDRISTVIETILQKQRDGDLQPFPMPNMSTGSSSKIRLGSKTAEDTMAAISVARQVNAEGIELVAYVPITEGERPPQSEPQSMIYAQLGAISLEQINRIVGDGQILFNSSQKS